MLPHRPRTRPATGGWSRPCGGSSVTQGLTDFSVSDVWEGWTEALRDLGQQVATFRLDDRLALYDAALIETGRKGPNGEIGLRKAGDHEWAIGMAINGLPSACFQYWPDVLLVVSAFYVPNGLLDLIRARGMRVVLVLTEEPYQRDSELDRAAHADVAVLNDPTHLDAFQQVTTAYYQPHSYRESIHHPGPAVPEMASDFAFVGTGYQSRIDFLERMGLDGLSVLLAGNWQGLDDASPLRAWLATDPDECLDNAATAEVYRSGLTSANLYRREADRPELATGWAMGPREVELAACGLWFARDPRPEGDELLGMLPTFTDAATAGELVRWALAHPEQRQAAAVAARAAVEDRTFTNAAVRLLELLDRQPATI